jgi:hypothetical protein
MSRNRGAREARKQDRHIRLYYWFMDTAAWKSLPATAKVIYVGLIRHYNGSNNGRIGYSVRQAAHDAKVSPDTAWRMFGLLQDRGFIVLMTKGAFSRKERHATEWRLTEYMCDVTGTIPSKEFTRWQLPQNLEHSTSHRTEQSDYKYRSVLPIGQNKTETPSYGPTTSTVEPFICPTTSTLIVNQGENAKSTPGPLVRRRAGRQ